MRYDPRRRELMICFRAHRDVYVYEDVPPEEWLEFRSAESKGTYLNQVFKEKEHRYRKLPQQDARRRGRGEEDDSLTWGERWMLPRGEDV
jgi:hypothetical protein